MRTRTITTLLLLLALLGITAPAQAKSGPSLQRMTPCVYEDGSGGSLPCYWDGTTRGNKTGLSFWIDKQERFHYLPTVRKCRWTIVPPFGLVRICVTRSR